MSYLLEIAEQCAEDSLSKTAASSDRSNMESYVNKQFKKHDPQKQRDLSEGMAFLSKRYKKLTGSTEGLGDSFKNIDMDAIAAKRQGARDHINEVIDKARASSAEKHYARQAADAAKSTALRRKALVGGGLALGAGAAYGAYRHFNNKTAAYNLVNQANSGMVNLGAHSGAGFAERKEYVKNAPNYMRLNNQQAFSAAKGTPIKGGVAEAAKTTASTASKAAPQAAAIKPGGFLSKIKGKGKMLAALGALGGVGGAAMSHRKTAATQEEIDNFNDKKYLGHPVALTTATVGSAGLMAGVSAGRAIHRIGSISGAFDEIKGQVSPKALRRGIVGGVGGTLGLMGAGLGYTIGKHYRNMQQNSMDPKIQPAMNIGTGIGIGTGGLVSMTKLLRRGRVEGFVPSDNALKLTGIRGSVKGALVGTGVGYAVDKLVRNNGRPKTAADVEYTADDMAASRERAGKLGLIGAGMGAATAPLLNKWTGGSFGGVKDPMLSAMVMGGGATYLGALTSMHKSKMQHISGNKDTVPSADKGAIAGALAGAGSGFIAGAKRFNSLHGRDMYPDRGRQAALIGASGLVGATLGGLAGGIAGYAHDVKVRGNGSNDAELYRKQREDDQALADMANGKKTVQKAKPAGDAAYSADNVNDFLSSYYGGKKTAADMTYDPTAAQYMEQTEQPPNSPKRSLGLIGAGAAAGAAVNAGLASRHNGTAGAYSQLIGKAKELGIPNAINESKGIARSISRSARSGGMLGAGAAVGALAAPYLTKKLKNQS